MRTVRTLALSCLAAATGVSAQQPAADPGVQVQALRQQLIAAQQEIVRLRAEAANARDLGALAAQCRDRNARLVAIGNDLIAAYHRRYTRGRFAPFDTGQRRFEAELQDVAGQVYDNRLDAGPRRPDTPPPAPRPATAAPAPPGTAEPPQ